MSVHEKVEQEIGQRLAAAGVPGCAVSAQLGDTPFVTSFGSADAAGTRAVDARTVFHLFSGTKLYTAAALMCLVEAGELSLDTEVREVLPEVVLRYPLTLRQLASHSSGLRDTLGAFMSVHGPGQSAPSTREALARYRVDNGGAPGKKAAYRNANYAILGEVIARAAGEPFEDYVTRKVLEPLGSRARFSYDDEMRAAAAEGTIRRFSPMRLALKVVMPGLLRSIEGARHGGAVALSEFSLDTAAIGGLVGCAADFMPLARDMLSVADGPVLCATSKRTMLTLVAEGRAGIASKVGVGLGWKCGRAGETTFWNHEGGGPGFTSETRIYPDDGVAAVLLMNATQNAKLSWLAHEVCELLRASRADSG